MAICMCWNVIRLATISADGSLGPWGTSALPGPVQGSAFNFYNDRLYLAGGLTSGDTVLNVSLSAFVSADGSIGTWRSEADLPVPLSTQGSVIVSNRIYLFGGLTNFSGGASSAI